MSPVTGIIFFICSSVSTGTAVPSALNTWTERGSGGERMVAPLWSATGGRGIARPTSDGAHHSRSEARGAVEMREMTVWCASNWSAEHTSSASRGRTPRKTRSERSSTSWLLVPIETIDGNSCCKAAALSALRGETMI